MGRYYVFVYYTSLEGREIMDNHVMITITSKFLDSMPVSI